MVTPAVAAATVAVLVVAGALLAPWADRLADDGGRWTSRVVVAVLAGAGGVVAGLAARTPVELAALAVVALAAALLVAVDAARHRLPDVLTLPTTALVLLLWTAEAARTDAWPSLGRAALAAAAVGAGFLLLALASPRSLGLGDVKLAAMLAATTGWFGWQAVLVGVVAAFVLGGLVAIVLLAARRVTRAGALAFGPWLVLGAGLALAL